MQVFTIIHLKQTMFLGYSDAAVLYLKYVLQVMLFPMLNALYFYISTF